MVNNAHRIELERGSPMACPDDRQDSLSTSTVPCTPVHNPFHPCTPPPPHCVPLVTRIQRDCALPQCRGNLASVLPGPISPYISPTTIGRYIFFHICTLGLFTPIVLCLTTSTSQRYWIWPTYLSYSHPGPHGPP